MVRRLYDPDQVKGIADRLKILHVEGKQKDASLTFEGLAERLNDQAQKDGMKERKKGKMEYISFSDRSLRQYEAGARVPDSRRIRVLASFYHVYPEYITGKTEYRNYQEERKARINADKVAATATILEIEQKEKDHPGYKKLRMEGLIDQAAATAGLNMKKLSPDQKEMFYQTIEATMKNTFQLLTASKEGSNE